MTDAGVVRQVARAKVNLTLEILGKRADSYHELASLVAFADVGDVVEVDPGRAPGVEVAGKFASDLAGPNILQTALDRLKSLKPDIYLGHVRLLKNLPVAAGVGGGSANAAALIRAVQCLNPDLASSIDLSGLALELGADVPVCLANEACWMTGIGDQLHRLPGVDAFPVDIVLVNPMARVPPDKTAQVFRQLAARPISDGERPSAPFDALADLEVLSDFVRSAGNDLQAPALEVVADIGVVLDSFGHTKDCMVSTMSGAGPTCFGLYPSANSAEAAATAIAIKHPSWWVCTTVLRSAPLDS